VCASLAHRTLLMAPTARFPPSPAAPRRTTRSHLERSRSRPRLEVTDAPECFDTTAFRENREVRWSSHTLGRAPTSRGRPGALLGRYGRATRLLRAVRAHDISQHLPISPNISPYLLISPHISPYLISPYLPISQALARVLDVVCRPAASTTPSRVSAPPGSICRFTQIKSISRK